MLGLSISNGEHSKINHVSSEMKWPLWDYLCILRHAWTKGQHLNGFMDYHVSYRVRVMVHKQASLSVAVML